MTHAINIVGPATVHRLYALPRISRALASLQVSGRQRRLSLFAADLTRCPAAATELPEDTGGNDEKMEMRDLRVHSRRA